MAIRPILARVLLEIDTEEKKHDIGNGLHLVIPTDERHIKGTELGKVITIGRLAFSPPIGDGECEIKVGDTVLIKRYSGTDVFRNNKRYRVVQDDDIIGVDE